MSENPKDQRPIAGWTVLKHVGGVLGVVLIVWGTESVYTALRLSSFMVPLLWWLRCVLGAIACLAGAALIYRAWIR